MAAEEGVIIGLLGIAALFAYYAFKLRESDNEGNKRIAVFLAFISLVFANITLFTVYDIANNSLAYLTGGALSVALLVMIWTTNLLMLYLLAAGVWGAIRWCAVEFPKMLKGRKDD